VAVVAGTGAIQVVTPSTHLTPQARGGTVAAGKAGQAQPHLLSLVLPTQVVEAVATLGQTRVQSELGPMAVREWLLSDSGSSSNGPLRSTRRKQLRGSSRCYQ
jgi:hypothetical protein